MKIMLHSIREVESADQPILWDLLYEALWDPPTSPRRPRSVLSNPHIAAYVRDWGSNGADLGFLAISHEGLIAGGILSRLLLPPLQGGAFYDANTPQLGIAVFPAFQKQGLGTSLFTRYLAAASTRFPRVSLGVHPENSAAIRLYRRFGFHQFATGNGGYLNMVKDFEKHPEPGAAAGGPASPPGDSGVANGPPSAMVSADRHDSSPGSGSGGAATA
jgi:ribosomal protein S18 acetylase RimI-like enzyme